MQQSIILKWLHTFGDSKNVIIWKWLAVAKKLINCEYILLMLYITYVHNKCFFVNLLSINFIIYINCIIIFL